MRGTKELVQQVEAEQLAWNNFVTCAGDEADKKYDDFITARCARLVRERELFEACGMDPATMARQLRAARKG
jgi:hypothetical protein